MKKIIILSLLLLATFQVRAQCISATVTPVE